VRRAAGTGGKSRTELYITDEDQTRPRRGGPHAGLDGATPTVTGVPAPAAW
jgi:hypothetical protein